MRLLRDRPQLPVPLRQMKRWWRNGKKGEVKYLFISSIVFRFLFVGGNTARVRVRYGWTGKWVGLGAWCEIPKGSVKILCLKIFSARCTAAHVFNTNTWEAEAGISLRSRPTWFFLYFLFLINILTFYFYLNFLLLFTFPLGGQWQGKGQIWRDLEASGIGVHDVKFSKNQKKLC